MQDIIANVVLGIVQGITEWLPISSSGHLAVVSLFFDLSGGLAYDVFLHLGSLFVIVIYFRIDILKLFDTLRGNGTSDDKQLFLYLIIATFITIAVAPWLNSVAVSVHENALLLSFAYIITTIVVGISFLGKGTRSPVLWSVVLIGLAQAFAVIPGISRSGMTIGVALLLGLRREFAFRFSFLAVIPIIVAAFIFILPQIQWQASYLLGFVVTVFVGYASLWLLERIIKKGWFAFFAIYTIVMAVLLMIYA